MKVEKLCVKNISVFLSAWSWEWEDADKDRSPTVRPIEPESSHARDTRVPALTAAQSVIAKSWNQPALHQQMIGIHVSWITT